VSEGAAQRLRQERERVGISQRALAELAGVNKNSQLAYENGRSPITLDYLERIEPVGIDPVFVVAGRRSGGAAEDETKVSDRRQAYRPSPRGQDDTVEVSEIDPRFGLGAAFMDETAVPEKRQFSRAWLRQISTSPPHELYWARGRGDSMKPTINDGEIVLIDRSDRTPRDADLIWAFAWGDLGAIKRLRPLPDGTVKILSDNESVPPETAVDGEIHIFGRVIAVVKKL
jgi:phage repressor protein C with HTH and peptisase S24 domain